MRSSSLSYLTTITRLLARSFDGALSLTQTVEL